MRRRRKVLIAVLAGGVALLLLALLGAACAPSPGARSPAACPPLPTHAVTPPVSGHLAYARTACGPLPLKLVWHPGETLQYEWLVSPRDPQPDGGDARVDLTFAVFGPFPTRAAAVAAQTNLSASHSPRPPGVSGPPTPPGTPSSAAPPVATALPIRTDTWNPQVYTSTVRLPRALAPGYYVLLATDVVGESATPNAGAPNFETGQVGAIIQVVMP